MQSIFHFAFNVTNLDQACEFYTQTLGCKQGRRADTWVDYNFFGHQLSLHLGEPFAVQNSGLVDNIAVPMPHFGAVLRYEDWRTLADQLIAKQLAFVIEPCVRFASEAGEQHTMFFYDPFGNPIELKGFANLDKVFD
jgi:extradiol dioxygenase family protein